MKLKDFETLQLIFRKKPAHKQYRPIIHPSKVRQEVDMVCLLETVPLFSWDLHWLETWLSLLCYVYRYDSVAMLS